MVVGAGLLNKCDLKVGDTVVLHDKYADKSYALTINGVTGNSADTSVYLT